MKSYSFSEFKELQEIGKIERLLGNLKKNKKEYAKLVFLIAIFMPKISFATSGISGGGEFAEIFNLAMTFAKYGCMTKGVMNMITEMMRGANIKEALSEGGQFFIFYIILKYYPVLFAMIK